MLSLVPSCGLFRELGQYTAKDKVRRRPGYSGQWRYPTAATPCGRSR